MLKSIQEDSKKNLEGQTDLFSAAEEQTATEANIEFLPEYPPSELLRIEKETTGLYLSGHPLHAYRGQIKAISSCEIKDLQDESVQNFDNQNIDLLCLINTVRHRVTKTNDTMAICTVEDLTGSLEMMVFPKKLEQYGKLVNENAIVIINARVSVKEDESVKLILNSISQPQAVVEAPADSVEPPEEAPQKPQKLYVRLPSQQSELYDRVLALLELFDGEQQVNLFFDDTRRQLRLAYGAQLCETLLTELRSAVGEKNVVIK